MVKPPVDMVLRSRRAVLHDGEQPAAVCVAGGRITEIRPYDARVRCADDRDVGGAALLPGLVDTHVHVNEPERTAWEGFDTATRAAALGGVTTLIDMPLNSVPPTTSVAALDAKRAAAGGRCHVDVGFWGGVVPANLPELPALHEAGVFGFKCFLADSGVPEFPPLAAAEFEAAARCLAALDDMLLVHAEDAQVLSDTRAAASGGCRRYADFLRSRPSFAEEAAVADALAVAGRTGSPCICCMCPRPRCLASSRRPGELAHR